MTKAPTKRRRSAKADMPIETTGEITFLQAVTWCDVAQRDEAALAMYEAHSIITDGWLCASDGTIAVGHKFPIDDLKAAPKTGLFLRALQCAGEGLKIVYDDEKKSMLVSGKNFRAKVPCVEPFQVPVPYPDPPAIDATDEFIEVIAELLPLLKAGSQTVLEASVLLTENGGAMATDRISFIDGFHGLQMPRMVIPRVAVALLKGQKGLTKIGGSGGTMTFWFGDNRYIRTQLHEVDSWPPSVDRVFDTWDGDQLKELPKGLAEAVSAVAPHNDMGVVHFGENCVRSQSIDNEANAVHDCKGTPTGLAFSGKRLAAMCKRMTHAAFHDQGKAYFYAEGKFRGALVTYAGQPAPAQDMATQTAGRFVYNGQSDIDTDIPY